MDERRRPSAAARHAAALGDERAAARARRILRAEGAVPIEPDERIGVMLEADERVVTLRRGVFVDRRSPSAGPGAGVRGDLYVTDRRLVHLGRACLELPLDSIDEAVVTGTRLLLVLRHGLGMTIELEDPGVLRVQLAAARAARRACDPGDRRS